MNRNLGLFETAQLLTDQFSPFNIVIVVGIDKLILAEFFIKSLKILQERHPLLRSVVINDNNQWKFNEKLDSTIDFESIERTSNDFWVSIVEQELNTGFDISTQPLIRCKYLSSNSHPESSEIIFTIHHSIIDAASSNFLVGEFLSIINADKIQSTNSVEYPKQYLAAAEKYYPSKYKGIRKYCNIMSYLGRQIFDELKYSRLSDSQKPKLIKQSKGCRIIQRFLSKDLTMKLIEESRKHKVTLYHICNAALIRSVAINLYENNRMIMRNFNFPNLRPYLVPPVPDSQLGAYHSLIRYSVDYSPEIGFWELSKLIQNKFGANIRKSDKFISPLMSVNMMKFLLKKKSMRMGNTALSFTGSANIKSNYNGIKVLRYNGFISNNILGPQITGQVNLFNNELYWNVGYLENDINTEQANTIADDIISIIKNGIRDK